MRTLPLALSTAALALSTVGCASHMSLQVLQPADVMLPSHIDTIAVIDRSRVTGAGEGVLGVLEGAVTGEAIGADREGRNEAVRGAAEVLQASPRYDAILVPMDKYASQSSLFDNLMGWKAATQVCKDVGCDAIVALESFDSDSWYRHDTRVDERTDDEGRTIKEVVHEVERETNVVVSWRLYDVTERRIIDNMMDMNIARTWQEDGSSEAEAMANLPNQYDTVRFLGHDNGVAYAMRIAPTYVSVSRSYYGRGSDGLKQAKNHVKAGDWEGATQIWLQEVNSPDTKVRGKAEYNLALAAEVAGDLETALQWARKGAVDLANSRSRSYVATIERRIADQQRLQQQMAPDAGDMY